MFARACALASDYTHPIVVSARRWDGRVECAVGAFVVLDQEGWILTAAHLLEPTALHAAHQAEIAAYQLRADAITAHEGTPAGKAKRIRALGANPDWLTNYSIWTGWDDRTVREFYMLPGIDVALGRLEPFDPSLVRSYPVLREPGTLVPGTSICRTGYPFHTVATTFDEAADAFVFAQGTFPMPQFVLEGMVTRIRSDDNASGEAPQTLLVETSTPGLRGQSGGPIFDQQGRLCAIQIHTVHYPLGFSPAVERGGGQTEEHQFLNVGVGVHVAAILPFLTKHGVRFHVS